MVTIYGVVAVTFMMCMYALERRHVNFVAAFALGCLLSSAYGFLAGAWPFGCVEVVWAGVAMRRWLRERHAAPPYTTHKIGAAPPAARRTL